jgi:dipeptidyl aminopeptidase/acylaminoacyl peptidase
MSLAHPLLALLAAAFSLSSAIAASPKPPVEAYGELPAITDVAISTDGNHLAWTENANDGQTVVMHELATSNQKRRFSIPSEFKVRSLTWADAAMLLITVSGLREIRENAVYRIEMFRTFSMPIEGGSARVLLMNDAERACVDAAIMVRPRISKPHTVVMWTQDWLETAYDPRMGSRLGGGRKDSGWISSLYQVDTRDGKAKAVARGSPYTNGWVADADGNAVARSDWEPAGQTFRILAEDKGGWREIYKQTNGEVLALRGLAADGKGVRAHGANGGKFEALWYIPLDGSGAKSLVADAARDVTWVERDFFSYDVVGVHFGGLAGESRWLDQRYETKVRAIRKAFPNRAAELVGRTDDFSKVIARVDSPAHPPTYYLIDFSSGKADMVGEEYPKLNGFAHGSVREISYPARDGYTVPAYLTIPAGSEPNRLPLVVLPHGGPESRDTLEFDWLSQFLASRGYAVLRPQFRGSTGFGEAHRLAGYGQWGRLMQDDVTDGVKALIADGTADPRRICIVGLSYGGYAALAGATLTPDLYACAASVAGVSDLPVMLGQVKFDYGSESDSVAYWQSHIGSRSDPKVIDASPARLAQRAIAPILLIHGEDDTVVPIAQSKAMARALQEARKEHQFVRLEGEDHWLSRGKTRIQVLTELDRFLQSHLGAR